MARSYAVVWSDGDELGSGRLEACGDRFELHGRETRLSIPFSEVAGASIARRQVDRLRGLPVLLLRRGESGPVRIASLEGPGVLHELARYVEAV
jgi:hypothetical protein